MSDSDNLPVVDVGVHLSQLFSMSLNFHLVQTSRLLHVLFLLLHARLYQPHTTIIHSKPRPRNERLPVVIVEKNSVVIDDVVSAVTSSSPRLGIHIKRHP